jgi:aryl-alcohol dehydrogenase-like predicted oxidoreductase
MLGARVLTEKNFKIIGALEEFAAARDRSLLELAFAWLAAQPRVVSIIAGASTPEQTTQNAKASSWTLTADEVARINGIVATFDASEARESTR